MEETQLRDCTIQLTAQPSALSWARHYTHATLCRWACPADLIETAKLLVSELATNAVRYGQPPVRIHQATKLPEVVAGQFGLRLCALGDGALRVEVQDHNPNAPIHRQVTDEDEGGRGLLLVEAMSRAWGYSYASPAGFKTVWCEISDESGRSPLAAQPLRSHPGRASERLGLGPSGGNDVSHP